MTKTITTEVPDWAKWKCQDYSGCIKIYADHPMIAPNEQMQCWTSRGPSWKDMVIGKGDPNPNWRDTLEELP